MRPFDFTMQCVCMVLIDITCFFILLTMKEASEKRHLRHKNNHNPLKGQ